MTVIRNCKFAPGTYPEHCPESLAASLMKAAAADDGRGDFTSHDCNSTHEGTDDRAVLRHCFPDLIIRALHKTQGPRGPSTQSHAVYQNLFAQPPPLCSPSSSISLLKCSSMPPLAPCSVWLLLLRMLLLLLLVLHIGYCVCQSFAGGVTGHKSNRHSCCCSCRSKSRSCSSTMPLLDQVHSSKRGQDASNPAEHDKRIQSHVHNSCRAGAVLPVQDRQASSLHLPHMVMAAVLVL